MLHNCNGSNRVVSKLDFPTGFYGEAIGRCWEKDGKFFVDNGEYCSQVNFCPYCGAEAPVKAIYRNKE